MSGGNVSVPAFQASTRFRIVRGTERAVFPRVCGFFVSRPLAVATFVPGFS
jgi:hypothetical protein